MTNPRSAKRVARVTLTLPTRTVNYRPGDGGGKAPNKRVVIGRFGRITPDQARTRAKDLLGRVARGEDPAGERAEARGVPTLAEAFETYMKANPNRAANTVRLYRQNLRVNLGDWVKRPLDAITRQDVEDRFNLITGRHGCAGPNQTMAMLRSIYRRPCVDHEGLRNPVELWLAAGGRFNRLRRRRDSGPGGGVPPRRAGGSTACGGGGSRVRRRYCRAGARASRPRRSSRRSATSS